MSGPAVQPVVARPAAMSAGRPWYRRDVRSVAERLALVEQIQGLWYPQWTSVWLKAVPVARLVRGERTASPREVLQAFLDRDLYNWLPEDSAYGTFTDCEWRPIERAELLRCVDAILRGATERIAEVRAEEAAERAEAEAGGYLHALGRSRLDGDTIDLDTLRRWFIDALWGAAEPAWFTDMGPGFDAEPAVIGVDGDVLALLWLP